MIKKNILMICYYFPPLTDVGCKRSVAFAKYFKKYGWNPYVLSVKNPDKTYCELGNDRPPPGIPTEYSYSIFDLYKCFGKINGLISRLLKPFAIDLKRNYFYDVFCIPDIFVGWIPLTIIRGLKLIKKYNIDIIYASCTPYSSAVIGVLLKLLTKKPLVVDFRDAHAIQVHALKGLISSPPRFRRALDRFIVGTVLKYSDIFLVVTDEINKHYVDQYHQVRDKIFTIHNGFDFEFNSVSHGFSKYSKFTIVYAGDLYSYALNSEIFFEAMGLLKGKGEVSNENFQFLFCGGEKDMVEQLARKYDIEDLVVASTRISYGEILNVISKSHLQFLRVVPLAVPTKLIEGIALNVPFIAIIPSGEAEVIIRKYSPSSYVIIEGSTDKVGDAILNAMAKYKINEIQANNVQAFSVKFFRENLSLKLMKIIQDKLGNVI